MTPSRKVLLSGSCKASQRALNRLKQIAEVHTIPAITGKTAKQAIESAVIRDGPFDAYGVRRSLQAAGCRCSDGTYLVLIRHIRAWSLSLGRILACLLASTLQARPLQSGRIRSCGY